MNKVFAIYLTITFFFVVKGVLNGDIVEWNQHGYLVKVINLIKNINKTNFFYYTKGVGTAFKR